MVASTCLCLVSIYSKLHDHDTKNKAIIRLSSHPSRQSLCFDSKLVVVVVVICLMETRLYDPSDYIETRLELYLVNRLLVGP